MYCWSSRAAFLLALVGVGACAFVLKPASHRHTAPIFSSSKSMVLHAGSGDDEPQRSGDSSSAASPSAPSPATGGRDSSELFYFHQQSAERMVATQFLRPSSIPNPPPKASPQTTRTFDRLLDFPCSFEIKVIGEADSSFNEDIVQLVGKATGKPWEKIEYTSRDTASGKYRSLTIKAQVENADQIYECYNLISKDSRVKFKF